MTRRALVLVAGAGLCIQAGSAGAQQVFSNTEPIMTVTPLASDRFEASPSTLRYGSLNIKRLRAIETQRLTAGFIHHFAVPSDVDIRPDQMGETVLHEDGMITWRLIIESKNATNINIGTEWNVPESMYMLLLDGEGDSPYDPFTAEFNNVNNQLWSPIIIGDTMEVYVEVHQDDWQAFVDGFRITRISLGFLEWGEVFVPNDDGIDLRSNSCHTDVACPEADPWPSQVSCVGAYTINGIGTCSGGLMNNVDEDGTPYFMTANHCGAHSSPASIVVYWNYESSFCRPPGSIASGQNGNGPLNMFTSGSVNKMTYQPADFTLNQLNSVPNPAWNVDYAGWDRSTPMQATPTNGFGIHHPNIQEKRIAFENNSFNTANISIGGGSISSWAINFDVGGLEGGSSGSPLFNEVGRVVGTATAVSTFNVICGSGQSQFYGRLERAWNGGGSPSSRLSNWLDPGATGVTTLNPLNWDPPFIEDFSVTSPTDAQTKVLVQPTITWTAAINADHYNLLIDDDPAFGSPEVDTAVNAPATSFVPSAGVLSEDTVYYLRVDAENILETVSALNNDVSFTTMTDCDGNLVHDFDELAGNDCNNNLILDVCDIVGGPFYVDSGELSPIGFGANKSLVLTSSRLSNGNVTLDFTARGDFEQSTERVTILLNGAFLGTVFDVGSLCPLLNPDTQQMIVPEATWNAAAASGTITILMAASSAVNAAECAGGSFIQCEVTYDSQPFSQDSNDDGIPDECGVVACSQADITTQGAGIGDPGFGVPDGLVTAADINFFINAWVAADVAIADVTTQGAGVGDPGFGVPDGLVTAADVNYFVNIWILGCP